METTRKGNQIRQWGAAVKTNLTDMWNHVSRALDAIWVRVHSSSSMARQEAKVTDKPRSL